MAPVRDKPIGEGPIGEGPIGEGPIGEGPPGEGREARTLVADESMLRGDISRASVRLLACRCYTSLAADAVLVLLGSLPHNAMHSIVSNRRNMSIHAWHDLQLLLCFMRHGRAGVCRNMCDRCT